MAKIKNDPRRYRKRTDLIRRRTTEAQNTSNAYAQNRDAYFAAPIDRRFYIDFRPVRPGRQK
jgi:hypothetical protein